MYAQQERTVEDLDINLYRFYNNFLSRKKKISIIKYEASYIPLKLLLYNVEE